MKRILFFLLLIPVLSSGQTLWQGPEITFIKSGATDPNDTQFQDKLTDNVIFTRGANKGIFNIAKESTYSGMGTSGNSPLDTEWAFGSISDGIGSLTFTTWAVAMDQNPPGKVNQPMVVHLITDNIYVDITFTTWSKTNMVYNRSTPGSLSSSDFTQSKLAIYPNPGDNNIYIQGITEKQDITIYNAFGQVVYLSTLNPKESVDISRLQSGVYFVKIGDQKTLKFIKK